MLLAKLLTTSRLCRVSLHRSARCLPCPRPALSPLFSALPPGGSKLGNPPPPHTHKSDSSAEVLSHSRGSRTSTFTSPKSRRHAQSASLPPPPLSYPIVCPHLRWKHPFVVCLRRPVSRQAAQHSAAVQQPLLSTPTPSPLPLAVPAKVYERPPPQPPAVSLHSPSPAASPA